MTALNFDPYAALAEIENGSGLRANRANRANPAPTLASLAPLALSPAQDAKLAGGYVAPAGPRQWQAELARLDAATIQEGYTAQRWLQLVEDARWLADWHACSAAALCWTASDLFGLDETRDGWGGLADRLEGARRVTFTDTVARWRSDHVDGWLWRRTLGPMQPIWEYAQ